MRYEGPNNDFIENNLYNFTSNDPVNSIDFNGLITINFDRNRGERPGLYSFHTSGTFGQPAADTRGSSFSDLGSRAISTLNFSGSYVCNSIYCKESVIPGENDPSSSTGGAFKVKLCDGPPGVYRVSLAMSFSLAATGSGAGEFIANDFNSRVLAREKGTAAKPLTKTITKIVTIGITDCDCHDVAYFSGSAVTGL